MIIDANKYDVVGHMAHVVADMKQPSPMILAAMSEAITAIGKVERIGRDLKNADADQMLIDHLTPDVDQLVHDIQPPAEVDDEELYYATAAYWQTVADRLSSAADDFESDVVNYEKE